MSNDFRLVLAQNYLNQLLKSRLDCTMAGVAKAEDYAALDVEIAKARAKVAELMN